MRYTHTHTNTHQAAQAIYACDKGTFVRRTFGLPSYHIRIVFANGDVFEREDRRIERYAALLSQQPNDTRRSVHYECLHVVRAGVIWWWVIHFGKRTEIHRLCTSQVRSCLTQKYRSRATKTINAREKWRREKEKNAAKIKTDTTWEGSRKSRVR